jgi:hypothetical protein
MGTRREPEWALGSRRRRPLDTPEPRLTIVCARGWFVRRSQRGIRTIRASRRRVISPLTRTNRNKPNEKPGASASVARYGEIAPHRNQAPDRLDNPEWPCPSKEPIGTGQRATRRECQDKASVTALDGVHQHHERDGNGAKRGEHFAECDRSRRGQASDACETGRGRDCPIDREDRHSADTGATAASEPLAPGFQAVFAHPSSLRRPRRQR